MINLKNNQLLLPHSNLHTTLRYNHGFVSMASLFKDSDLYILAAFSNANFKDDMYHVTASTIFSETPFNFKKASDMIESFRVMNVKRINLFIVDDVTDYVDRKYNT